MATTERAPHEEEPLEPELPIVDPHHHLFERTSPPYLLDDLRADIGASGQRVVASVYVEAGTHFDPDAPTHLRPVGETAWVAAQAGTLLVLTGRPLPPPRKVTPVARENTPHFQPLLDAWGISRPARRQA